MLIISFDAMGNPELDILSKYPTLSAFMETATVFRDIPSIFVTNTYPIHASISTGVTPDIHGISANVTSFPEPYPIWSEDERGFRVKTLWQAAAEKGIETAAVLWPVTAFSKTIRYNIPEMHKQPDENLVITNIKAGSKLLQFKMFLRYGKLLDGYKQPDLDDFSVSCMVDILKKHNPGLALMHLTAYDSLCHEHGRYSDELEMAYKSLDHNLARLLEAAGEDRDVVIFSDHSQQNVHTSLNPNDILVESGLLYFKDNVFIKGDSGCFFECCGGTAFFHAGTLVSEKAEEVRNAVSQSEGFSRFLTDEEMRVSGQSADFGFCANIGYCYDAFPKNHKATHGYPLDAPDYKVFYMYRFKGDFNPTNISLGNSLLDITSLVAERMGLEINNK